MGIGKRLEQLMIRQNIKNVAQLAKMSGIPASTIYTIMQNDPERVSARTLQSLSEALSCETYEIMGTPGETLQELKELAMKRVAKYKRIERIKKEGTISTEMLVNDYRELISLIDEKMSALINGDSTGTTATQYLPIISAYNELNDKGQIEAIKRLDEMTRLEEYTRQDGKDK